MRCSASTLLGVAALVTSIEATISITQPAANANIDADEDFTVSWSSAPGDPETITLSLTCATDICTAEYIELAKNIPTSDGSVTIRANTIRNFASRESWRIEVRDSSGSIESTSAVFNVDSDDSDGSDDATTITPTGSESSTIVTTNTTSTATTGTETGITITTTDDDGSVVTSTTRLPSTITEGPVTTTTSASQTSPTNTNAQPRLGGEGTGMFLTMAGVLAGFVALVA